MNDTYCPYICVKGQMTEHNNYLYCEDIICYLAIQYIKDAKMFTQNDCIKIVRNMSHIIQ